MEVERVCKICGRKFMSCKKNGSLCSEDCRAEARRRRSREWARQNKGRRSKRTRQLRSIRKEEQEEKEQQAVEKLNRIVAIGYAERQMAESLKRAGRVKTEL